MCCLFGLIDYGHTLSGKQKSRIISTLATACEVRGKDATGIAYNNKLQASAACFFDTLQDPC